jgi:hypothetical protein
MGAKLLGKLKLWTKQMQILLDRFPFFLSSTVQRKPKKQHMSGCE